MDRKCSLSFLCFMPRLRKSSVPLGCPFTFLLQEDDKGPHGVWHIKCNLCSYIGQSVPQVLVVCIFVAVFSEVSHYPTLKHIIRQKVSQHMQDTCSLVGEKERVNLINQPLQVMLYVGFKAVCEKDQIFCYNINIKINSQAVTSVCLVAVFVLFQT